MSWDSKVLWTEGLLMEPHHFQQSDRYTEALVAGLSRSIAPYSWGVAEIELDEDALKLGKFAIHACTGLTQDGAVFRVPQTEDHPVALEVPANSKDCVVFITIPERRRGAAEVDLSGATASAARFVPSELEITDTMSRDRKASIVAVGKLRLAFGLATDDLADMLRIPVARIIEVGPNGEVILDKGFIPSCLDCRAAPPLATFLTELEGMLRHRANALSARMADAGSAKGASNVSDFMLLQTVNRNLPVIRHFLTVQPLHPERLFQQFVALAGELSSFMASERQVPEFPGYRHDDLAASFAPVMRILRQYLSAVLEQNAVSIPLEPRKYGISVGVIGDRKLIDGANFVLAVKADVPAEDLRRNFAGHSKIGSVEEIRQMVNSALPGIAIRPLPVAPRQIPYHTGVVYCELDRSSPHWAKMTTSGGIAVHVSGEYPGLSMELWAIQEG
ncbi:type VI secretion system baseplate subunit TssK [Algicella marina]|uniref:Type VI secretion system baseplate subunit TssK n=1 Tax=Algicella marina TaxID=2683284 RepID=A0A6P1T7I8_9RHOB|nr:type VI secretion system baseplate subunit TssK [Algicella marina]QHQ36542.1 type VI secretion system baseplate subunit TssK [Algicella marina]